GGNMTDDRLAYTSGSALLVQVIERARDPERYERWLTLAAHAGYCRRPVRLRGKFTESDARTGELRRRYSTAAEPEGVLLKACGNRRSAVCPSCSAVYKGDAWQLVVAGLRGGKGVPDSVAEHPMLFATLTAPSFGPVHTVADQDDQRTVCRPRRPQELCVHGRHAGCWRRHHYGEALLGDPICPDCFDYESAVIWNALAPELWRRTTIYVRRALARVIGVSQRQLSREARISYTKVAEYQRRGALHFHAVFRLDGVDEAYARPPARVSADDLEDALRCAVDEVSGPHPLGSQPLRWGQQLHIRHIRAEAETTAEAAAAYLAKYATKSADDLGLCGGAPTREHIARLQQTASRLAESPELKRMGLSRAVESLGFRGHWSTRSRRYSTTFAALRQARVEHAKAATNRCDRAEVRLDADWRYAGIGYATAGDAWLAATAAQANRERRDVAKLELRSGGR
ncbi:MAG: replication initiator, partial [Solirubrobacteraceae bacterium]